MINSLVQCPICNEQLSRASHIKWCCHPNTTFENLKNHSYTVYISTHYNQIIFFDIVAKTAVSITTINDNGAVETNLFDSIPTKKRYASYNKEIVIDRHLIEKMRNHKVLK